MYAVMIKNQASHVPALFLSFAHAQWQLWRWVKAAVTQQPFFGLSLLRCVKSKSDQPRFNSR